MNCPYRFALILANVHLVVAKIPKISFPRASVNNTQRDSVMTVDGNQEGAPNYFPNSFSGADHDKKWAQHVDTLTGDVARHDSSNDDNFSQVRLHVVG